MFIKWRVYRRRAGGEGTDKFFLQPILAVSYRVRKAAVKKQAMEALGLSEEEFSEKWQQGKERINRPRHNYLYKFPRFPSCAYVHYESPGWIEQRKIYWEMLDIILDESPAFAEVSEAVKQMIRNEIESILPRPTEELLEALEEAYERGMPRETSPRDTWDLSRTA